MSMNLTLEQLGFIKLILSELAIMSPLLLAIFFVMQGIKCLLRNEMLNIYYYNREKQTLRQYEYENFEKLYKAYKALRGNSFVDKIFKEIQTTWEVVP